MVVTKRKTVHHYKISVEFWNKIKPLLPLPKPKKKPRRPREDDWKILSNIFYVLRTGCQWKALPRCYGAPSTVMIDLRNGKKRDYLIKCGKLTCGVRFNEQAENRQSKELT